MKVILILLVINLLISILLTKLTIILSTIYVENSKILAPTIKEDVYDRYLLIYNDPQRLYYFWLFHIPILNIYCCFEVYLSILKSKIKINKIKNGK
jgi:hypothetical protein